MNTKRTALKRLEAMELYLVEMNRIEMKSPHYLARLGEEVLRAVEYQPQMVTKCLYVLKNVHDGLCLEERFAELYHARLAQVFLRLLQVLNEREVHFEQDQQQRLFAQLFLDLCLFSLRQQQPDLLQQFHAVSFLQRNAERLAPLLQQDAAASGAQSKRAQLRQLLEGLLRKRPVADPTPPAPYEEICLHDYQQFKLRFHDKIYQQIASLINTL